MMDIFSIDLHMKVYKRFQNWESETEVNFVSQNYAPYIKISLLSPMTYEVSHSCTPGIGRYM